MSIHDDPWPGEVNVLCDVCRSNHVHLGRDSHLADVRLSTRLEGWITTDTDEGTLDMCPDCTRPA